MAITYNWGEKSLWREPFQKVLPEVMVPTIVLGQGGNEIGFGLYPPREPDLTASEKLQIQQPLFLGWENTPIICWWNLDAFTKVWWGIPLFGYTANG